MKRKLGKLQQRLGAAILAVLLLLSMVTPCAAADDSGKVLRVAFPEAYGYTMTDSNGQRHGLVVDALNEIAKYTGWKYEYIDVDSEEILERFQAGEFDLMGGQYYIEGLEDFYGYPDYNCGYAKLVLLARRSDDSIKSYDYSTFKGKTIGVFERAEENIRRLQLYLETNNIDCTLKYYTYDELAAAGGSLNAYLESGEVDLVMGNSADAGDTFYIAAAFESQPHYIVTMPDNQEVLDGLNMALAKINESNPNFIKELYDNNFPAVGNSSTILSSEEAAYVAEKKTVSVAVTENWHPLFCLHNEAAHDGLLPEMLKEVTSFSGLEFTYVYCDSYAEMVEKVQRGEADLLGFYMGTDEEAIDKDLALTKPYVTLNSILVRNKESSYPAEGLVGGVLKGRTLPAGIHAKEVRTYLDPADGLADVNRGKIDFYYGISANLENVIQRENYANIVQVALINDSIDIRFGMTSPAQPELFTILNKVINNLTDRQRSEMTSRNIVSVGESRMTLLSILYANPGLFITIVMAFFLLVLSIVILIYKSRLRAAAMRSELEKAEADSRAKSDFLSRMSHEIRTPMNAIVGLTELTERMDGWSEAAQENLRKIKSSSRYLLSLISDILDMSRIESSRLEMASEPFSLNSTLDAVMSMMSSDAGNRKLNFQIENQSSQDVFTGDAIRLRQVLINLLSNAFKFTPAGGSVLLTVTETAAKESESTLTFSVKDTGVGIAPEDQERIFRSFEQGGTSTAKSQGTGLGLAISSSIVHFMGGELKLKSSPNQGSEFYFTVTLPKGTLIEPVQPEKNVNELQGIHILLAEDNDLNAEIAKALLEQQGARVTRAENGKLAMQLFENSEPGEFRVILMDIMMPEMGGLEATRSIRALPRADAKTIPIIAMTANAFQEDVETAHDAGMTGFIPKPIDVSLLYSELHKALSSAASIDCG